MRIPIQLRLTLLFLSILFSPVAEAQFGFHAGTHLSFGQMGDESGSVEDRSMGSFDLQFMPGYRYAGLMGGLLLDYRFVSQITSTSDAGSDLGGRSFLWGLGITWEPAIWKFLFSYDFRARHSVSEPENTYKGSGFHLLAGYEIAPNLYVDLQYSRMRYNTLETTTSETGLGENPVRHWNLGLGISYSY